MDRVVAPIRLLARLLRIQSGTEFRHGHLFAKTFVPMADEMELPIVLVVVPTAVLASLKHLHTHC